MDGSHCDSRPFPLSGQVAISWIAALPQENKVQMLGGRRTAWRHQAHLEHGRAMAQMCYIEKRKLADVLDIASRVCEDAPNHPQIARIWEHFKMLGNRILEKQ